MFVNPLKIFNWSIFLQTQIYMLPVMLLFYQENGLSVGDYFLFQGIFSITALLFEIPSGYLGDIFPRKNILILSYLLFILRLLLWIFFGGYWIVLIGEILYSASKATYAGVADGYIYDYLKTKRQTARMLQYYGRLNFFMSTGTALASLLGAFFYGRLQEVFGAHTGFLILLVIELAFNTVAVLFLFFLPKVPPVHRKKILISERYKELYHITKQAFTDRRINWYMFYSGILAGTTMLFVWGFQPIMKNALFPVFLFGFISFFNHACRAGAGFFLHRTIGFFSLKGVGILTYVLFVLSFLSAIAALYFGSVGLTFCLLTFICVAIGFQLSFTLGSIGRIHTLVSSDIRSTVASVNNLVSRSVAGLLLISFKFLLDQMQLIQAYWIYLGIFVWSVIPLLKVLKTQTAATPLKRLMSRR